MDIRQALALVADRRDLSLEDMQAVMGQIMVFAAARTVALEELGWSDFTAGRVGQVIDAALPAVLGALRLPPPQRPSQGSA